MTDSCDDCTSRGPLTPTEQARADAMADAETLLINACDLLAEAMVKGRNHDEARNAYALYWELERNRANGVAYHVEMNHANKANELAYGIAKVAFRAVPGLRGEE